MLAAAAFAARPASAQNRSFCTDRSDAQASACSLDAGQAIAEVTALAYDLSSDPINRNDTLVLADLLLRLGLDHATELQLGVSPLVHATTRDRRSGARVSDTGLGDSYVALRRTIGDASAIELYATLPTGQGAAGAGTWGAGVALPIGLQAPPGFQLTIVPQVDALPDASGEGRHLSYGGAIGLARDLGASLVGTIELYAVHDLDPAGAGFNGKLAGILAWQLSDRLQLNVEADVGTAHAAPKAAMTFGIAYRP